MPAILCLLHQFDILLSMPTKLHICQQFLSNLWQSNCVQLQHFSLRWYRSFVSFKLILQFFADKVRTMSVKLCEMCLHDCMLNLPIWIRKSQWNLQRVFVRYVLRLDVFTLWKVSFKLCLLYFAFWMPFIRRYDCFRWRFSESWLHNTEWNDSSQRDRRGCAFRLKKASNCDVIDFKQ